MSSGGGKYSLESVMEEIRNIKDTQERYAQQYVQSQTASGPSSLSFVADDAQGLQLRAIDHSIRRLEKIVEELAKGQKQMERELDDLEQYGRRNCLILHGCNNVPKERNYFGFEQFVVNKLNTRLKLDYIIKPIDIDTCHVLPSRYNRPPPIIIKFVRRSIRDLVYGNKKKLKEDNNQEKLSLTESLTRRRLQLVTEAKKGFGFRNVWTTNGDVFCFHNNRRQVINDFDDIDKILKS